MGRGCLWADRRVGGACADREYSWYIYYTAGNSANLDGQRPHVLKGESAQESHVETLFESTR